MTSEQFTPAEAYKSPLSEFVVENVTSYDQLNADNLEEGEKRFAETVADLIPPLDELKRAIVPVKGGHTSVYECGDEEHKFYVKDPQLGDYGTYSEYDFQKLQEDHLRAKKYLEDYIPVTAFITRKDKQTNTTEYLIAQDISLGPQAKAFYRARQLPEISDNMKTQFEDILQRCGRMYKETGYMLDFDFILDTENDRIVIFDTDQQVKNVYEAQGLLEMAEKGWRITIPEKLKADFIQIS